MVSAPHPVDPPFLSFERSQVHEVRQVQDEGREQTDVQLADWWVSFSKQDILSPREDYRSQFYKYYRREAEECDREFMMKI